MVYAYLNLDAEQRDTVAPLYRLDDLGQVCPAFIQLDRADGEITFGVGSERRLLGPDQRSGRFIRWSVPSQLQGERLEAFAEKLLPLMRQLLKDAYDIGSDTDQPFFALDANAEKKIKEIEVLISNLDREDPEWMADIRDVGDYVQSQPDWLSAQTTDSEIDLGVASIEDEASAERIALVGSLSELLRAMRESARAISAASREKTSTSDQEG